MNEIWPFAAKIIELLTSQNKLTDELSERINQAASKQNRRHLFAVSSAAAHWQTQAREAGLEPIALAF